MILSLIFCLKVIHKEKLSIHTDTDDGSVILEDGISKLPDTCGESSDSGAAIAEKDNLFFNIEHREPSDDTARLIRSSTSQKSSGDNLQPKTDGGKQLK